MADHFAIEKILIPHWDHVDSFEVALKLIPIEVHYMEKNPGMFSSKTLISFHLKKERIEHLGWHGGGQIISIFFMLKVN